ncbi:hypothetical protein ABEB36_008349 [Hypothenemus hampei]|uniref:Uncharacterized protein n=1 Tax=Hypothenemus hampei TaxID=57062 RepID=A0ABD1ENR7_HYPHA
MELEELQAKSQASLDEFVIDGEGLQDCLNRKQNYLVHHYSNEDCLLPIQELVFVVPRVNALQGILKKINFIAVVMLLESSKKYSKRIIQKNGENNNGDYL